MAGGYIGAKSGGGVMSEVIDNKGDTAVPVGNGGVPTPPGWKPGESGNPNGRPKGSRNWSTVIRELLEDEKFEIKFTNGEIKKYPAFVIAEVMAKKAASGDTAAATWLAKYGYGDKVTHDFDPGFLNVAKMEITVVKPKAEPEREAEPSTGAPEQPADH